MNFTVCKSIEEIDRKKFETFAGNHPHYSVFQSLDIYDFFDLTDNFEPVALTIENEKAEVVASLVGVIIREYGGFMSTFSSRTVVYGGPLIAVSHPDHRSILDLVLKSLIRLVRNKSIFIQFRNFFDFRDDLRIFKRNGFDFQERLNFLVSASDEKSTLSGISKSKLRQIRSSLRAGAEIVEPQTLDEVREFYDILHMLYKEKVRKPLPSWSFFATFYHQSKKGKVGKYLLIRYNGSIVGGVLCPITEGRVIYEWYVCGLDHDITQVHPSVLATWAPIDYALRNNISTFDFMGVGKPDKPYGVREFKSKFGGELVNFGRFGRINNSFYYTIAEIGYNILSIFKKI